MIKNLIAVLGVIALFGLTGCGDTSNTEKAPAAAPEVESEAAK